MPRLSLSPLLRQRAAGEGAGVFAVCRSDSSKPPAAGLGSCRCRARSRLFPPTRQGVPASRLPAAEGWEGGTALRGRRAWQSWFLAFSPHFLSRTGRGMGPSANLLPRERSQEIASLLIQVPPLR
ncbi:hypothetical protein P7K49_015666 [Saguinus oedipus]|uniref:Uncharacterized protein n=1 Tax=Saguinus oedipus TaxID=9490 RepID=A0ABQ9VAA9_SAGOE|nr:hypothetical protein P7K49_015666 [Saguinus oedipus]